MLNGLKPAAICELMTQSASMSPYSGITIFWEVLELDRSGVIEAGLVSGGEEGGVDE